MPHLVEIATEDMPIALARRPSGYALIVDQEEKPAALVIDDDGAFRLTLDGHSTHGFAARDGDFLHVRMEGQTFEIKLKNAADHFSVVAEAEGEQLIRAPMPGIVVQIFVKQGDPVAPGDNVIVIESMKLETAITASLAGVVNLAPFSVGQSFERDAILVGISSTQDSE